jgi:hypothetical protein
MPLTGFDETLCKIFYILHFKLANVDIFNIRKLVIIKHRKDKRLRWEWSDARSETHLS